MKAVRYHSYGASGVLVYEDADRPVAGSGQTTGRPPESVRIYV